jgi:hypothetical protein
MAAEELSELITKLVPAVTVPTVRVPTALELFRPQF